jgi:hypothetical protein
MRNPVMPCGDGIFRSAGERPLPPHMRRFNFPPHQAATRIRIKHESKYSIMQPKSASAGTRQTSLSAIDRSQSAQNSRYVSDTMEFAKNSVIVRSFHVSATDFCRR